MVLRKTGQIVESVARPSRSRNADDGKDTAWRSEIGKTTQSALEVGKMVHSGNRRHHVERRLRERIAHDVALYPMHTRIPFAGAFEDLMVEVETYHLGERLAQLGCQQSIAGADVEGRTGALWHHVEDAPVIVDVVVPPPGALFHLSTVPTVVVSRKARKSLADPCLSLLVVRHRNIILATFNENSPLHRQIT